MIDESTWSQIARYLGGGASEEERRAFDAQLAADPALREEVEAARRVWESTAPAAEQWDVATGWGELVKKERAAATPPLAIVRPDRVRRRAAPAVADQRWRPRVPTWAAAAAVALALGMGLWWWGPSASREVAGPVAGEAMYTVATKPGQRLDLRMPDGSRIVLGVASTLRYPKTYGTTRRDLYLAGQAYFEVRHDAAHPFTVYAGGAVARDLGTRFGVRSYPDDRAVEVAVAEGEVEVSARTATPKAPTGRAQLQPRQVAYVDPAGVVTMQAGVDLDPYLAWADGRLVFRDVPLRELLPQLSRWYGREFRVTDSALAARRVTATFHDESLPALLQFLALSLDAEYEQDGRTVVLMPQRRTR